MADLSAGTGMGSSSSYTVGLLQGLNQMLRRHIPLSELAEEACKIEIELIGKAKYERLNLTWRMAGLRNYHLSC